jgi:hypothetical protein
MSVNNLAVHLAEADRRADGLAAAQEALHLYRELAQADFEVYEPVATEWPS